MKTLPTPLTGAFLILVLALAGCGKPDPNARPLRPGQVTDFGDLFAQNCAGCHGSKGSGGAAPPLNDPLFLKIMPDSSLHSVITKGRSGTLMPAFARDQGGPLTTEQVKIVVEGIRGWGTFDPQLSDQFLKGSVQGNSKAGLKVFETACAGCHGDGGQGTKDAGALRDPFFLALISDQALRRIIITGRVDLHMPSYQNPAPPWRSPEFKPLTPQDVADLVALLASWRSAEALAQSK